MQHPDALIAFANCALCHTKDNGQNQVSTGLVLGASAWGAAQA